MAHRKPKPRRPSLSIKRNTIILDGDELKLPSAIPSSRSCPRGASGIIILAHNKLLDRHEALKIWIRLRPRDRRDKFRQGVREAQAAAAVQGGVAVTIHSAGSLIDKYFYMTMEMVHGRTLAEHLKTKPDRQLRMAIARDYLDALRACEEAGVLHGDAHPGNVMLEQRGRGPAKLKLLDFGTSRFARRG